MMEKIIFDAVFILLGYGNDPSDKQLKRFVRYAVNLSKGFKNPLFIFEGTRSDLRFPKSEAEVMCEIAVKECGYDGCGVIDGTSVNTDENIFKAFETLRDIKLGKVERWSLDNSGFSVNIVFDRIRHLKVPDFCKKAARELLYRHPFNIIGFDMGRSDKEAKKQIGLSLLEMVALRIPPLRRLYANYKHAKIASTKVSKT